METKEKDVQRRRHMPTNASDVARRRQTSQGRGKEARRIVKMQRIQSLGGQFSILDPSATQDVAHGTPGKEEPALQSPAPFPEERKTAGEPGAGVAGHFSSNQPTSRSSQATRALDWKDKGTGGRRASDYGCVIGTNGGPPRVEWVGERAWFVRGFELAWQVWQFVLGSSFPGPGRWLMARRRGTLNIEASRTDDYMRLCTYVPFSVAHCPFYGLWYVYTDMYVETANSSPSWRREVGRARDWEFSRTLFTFCLYVYVHRCLHGIPIEA